ncbi:MULTISPECIES: DUF4232 domain-containing protein [Streptomyces]|uniref:DUF4232 domain-containing protein n=1 Tax=Streptomyces solicathayae TaxID=3081768 RepID=A0ABZ0LS17_9ACTN|nr:DUF4232 domain-containing protein [Streptomyces sp. HUAS YS2]WOX22285.1 DUF4232 domain-containing protein [Streptomyces sp. HUAS YS2]
MRATIQKKSVLAAAVLALSLGLTACGGGDAGTDAKAKDGATASQGAEDSAAKTSVTSASGGSGTAGGGTAGGSTTGGSGAKSGGSGSAGSTGSSGSGGSGKAPACTVADVKITMAKADETPTEHIVLTAKNTSGRACTILQYPLIAFGDIQTAKDVPAVAKSKPAAKVVLQPGAPAYANVRVALGGVDEDNKVVKSFNVNLFAADGPAEGSEVVTVPAGGLAVAEAAAKTGYWTPELRNGADEF